MTGYVADAVLILASLLWLLDFSPLDYVPTKNGYAKSASIVNELTAAKVIAKSDVKFNNATTAIYSTEKLFTLLELIKENLKENGRIHWDGIIAIGIYELNIPVAGKTSDGFRSVFLMDSTNQIANSPEIVPVGFDSLLETWVNARHQRNVTVFIGALLLIGFGFQLTSRILS